MVEKKGPPGLLSSLAGSFFRRFNVFSNGIGSGSINYTKVNQLTTGPLTGPNYRTGYQYSPDKGRLTGIKYPGAQGMLEYGYNELNQLRKIVGFTTDEGFKYDNDGALKQISYINGVVTSYEYDNNRRLSSLRTVGVNSSEILKYVYGYDNSNNITGITEGTGANQKVKSYDYDAVNQLTRAVIQGKFMEAKETPGKPGMLIGDYNANLPLSYVEGTAATAMVKLDYMASTIGLDFGPSGAPAIKKILLVPGGSGSNHRIKQGTFDLYISNNNENFTLIPASDYQFAKDSSTGVVTLTFTAVKSARYLKIHVLYDDLDDLINPVSKATFLNELGKMLRVYQEASSRIVEYQYDAAGNRTLERVTLVQSSSYASSYYANSDRLKTNGKYAFKYDAAGNLTHKGNKYDDITDDSVTFTKTSGEGVEYWQYTYDLLNRLISVSKNGNIVATYKYSPDGLRQVRVANGVTTHYVFEGTEPIFVKNITENKIKSYVFAGTKLIARVDGVIGNTTAKKYWYHTDHLGTIKAVTDNLGVPVWKADYFSFGQQYGKEKIDPTFEEDDLGFTGKGFDTDIGLYYFNARWYDADTGRFISEDPIADPNNPNLYTYCANNPMNAVDPDGYDFILLNDSNAVRVLGIPQGHSGCLVGNDVTGWEYYSKEGSQKELSEDGSRTTTENGNFTQHYATLNDFYNDSEISGRYDRSVRIPTSENQDRAMITTANVLYDAAYSFLGNNCADLVNQIAKLGDIGITGISRDYNNSKTGIDTPNFQYENALRVANYINALGYIETTGSDYQSFFRKYDAAKERSNYQMAMNYVVTQGSNYRSGDDNSGLNHGSCPSNSIPAEARGYIGH